MNINERLDNLDQSWNYDYIDGVREFLSVWAFPDLVGMSEEELEPYSPALCRILDVMEDNRNWHAEASSMTPLPSVLATLETYEDRQNYLIRDIEMRARIFSEIGTDPYWFRLGNELSVGVQLKHRVATGQAHFMTLVHDAASVNTSPFPAAHVDIRIGEESIEITESQTRQLEQYDHQTWLYPSASRRERVARNIRNMVRNGRSLPYDSSSDPTIPHTAGIEELNVLAVRQCMIDYGFVTADMPIDIPHAQELEWSEHVIHKIISSHAHPNHQKESLTEADIIESLCNAIPPEYRASAEWNLEEFQDDPVRLLHSLARLTPRYLHVFYAYRCMFADLLYTDLGYARRIPAEAIAPLSISRLLSG